MQKTPLYDEHCRAGAKVIDFHGWALPVQYAGIIEEHTHTRAHVSLFDCSHMGEFRIQGREAIEHYNRLVCSDAWRIRPGRARYGAMLNEQGGIIDDIITFRVAEEELFVVTNAGPLEQVSARICGGNPGAHDLSAATAKIDLQGPQARAAAAAAGIEAAVDLKYFGFTQTTWRGTDLLVSRTGYTGELGYELYLPAKRAPDLWQALLAIEDVRPAGLGARDTLRTEVGYLLSGQDFDAARTPLEAGLDAFIAWDTEFVGKSALEAQRQASGFRRLTPIRTADRRAPRHGFVVYAGDQAVGEVTSGTFGPSVGHGIGMAYLDAAYTALGTALTAGPRALAITVADVPFYKAGTCRD